MAKRSNENTLTANLYKIAPEDIVVEAGFNSRVDFDLEELTDSIAKNGVLNPISVVPFNDENGNEKYRLVDGERRYRAVTQAIKNGADIKRVPALFVSKSATREELLIQQVLRNDGKKFNEYECGVIIKKIMDVGNYSAQEVLDKLGWKSWKAVYLAHLERDERVQKLLKEGKIEGVTVRHIYQAHKDDPISAVNEILGAQGEIGKKDKDGKEVKKITLNTLNELNAKSKTIAKKDTEKIATGLQKLFQYLKPYEDTGLVDVLDIESLQDMCLSFKKNGMTITEVLEGALQKFREAKQEDIA